MQVLLLPPYVNSDALVGVIPLTVVWIYGI
jgi:hypothetical protein